MDRLRIPHVKIFYFSLSEWSSTIYTKNRVGAADASGHNVRVIIVDIYMRRRFPVETAMRAIGAHSGVSCLFRRLRLDGK